MEINNLDIRKFGLKYLLIFSTLIFSSSASSISKSDILLVILVISTTAINLKSGNFSLYIKKIVSISVVCFLIIVCYYLKNNDIDIFTWTGFLCRVILAFNVVHYCSSLFIPILIRLVYYLCYISLILYVLQLLSFNEVFKINNLFGLEAQRGLSSNSSSLFFTMVDIHSSRNCGFMWEPGAFAAIILFTLAFAFKVNTALDRYKIIPIIALLTTFSTTGYITFTIILSYFFLAKYRAYASLLLIPILFLLNSLDFITLKIDSQINAVQEELLSTQYSNEHIIHLNRFASFMADYNTFVNNPFLGLGIDINTAGRKEFLKEYDENVVRTSGLMTSLVKFGIVGILFFLTLLYKSLLDRFKDKRFALIFCIIYLLILFSNPIDFSVIVLTFIFL